MKRNGKQLRTLEPGDKRRLADARNAYKKMTPAQRDEFAQWVAIFDAALSEGHDPNNAAKCATYSLRNEVARNSLNKRRLADPRNVYIKAACNAALSEGRDHG